MDFKELKEKSGMTNAQINEFSEIPERTLENWSSRRRIPPNYVVNLLLYKMIHEGVIKEENNDDVPTSIK